MELMIIISALLIVSVCSWLSISRKLIEIISIAVQPIVLVSAIIIALQVARTGSYTWNNFFGADSLVAIMLLLVSCVSLITAIYSVAYLRAESKKEIVGFSRVRQYFTLFHLFIAAMILTITSSSPILAWVCLEATTLSTALLISFYNKQTSIEGAWKYFVINAVGLLLAFFGTLLFFTSSSEIASSGLVTWDTLRLTIHALDPVLVKIAFILVIVGYGTKVGFVPMHTWLPDAHSKAPAPISALLSGVLLNVAFLVVLRFKNLTDAALTPAFSQNLLIIFGLLSILVAALIIFTQKNYKRLLAYSSIENMGLLALGFGFGGLGVTAALLHMVYHSLLKPALFLLSGNLLLTYSSSKIVNVRGALKAIPVTAALFVAGFVGIVGLPPFGMFMTKIGILASGFRDHPAIIVTVLAALALLAIGFFKHVTVIVYGEPPEKVPVGRKLGFWLYAPPLALILLALGLSYYLPPFIQTLIQVAASKY